MKILTRLKIKLLATAFCLLGLAPWARGEEPLLTLTVAKESVAAGGQLNVWLNALNVSTNAISWAFPQQVEGKIVSPQGTFAGSLALLLADTNAVVIAPGTFVRREYVSALPPSVTGQAVMDFPGLNVNRVAVDVKASAVAASEPEKKVDSLFTRFIKEAEPAEASKGSGPGQFFKEHISGYEPMYFIAGPKSPNAKFQISFAYQILNSNGPLATRTPGLKGFHIAYTQTSLWDLAGPSATFYDTSYKPEFFYVWENVTRAQPTNWFQLDLQGGLMHESNGKGGADSRSLNIAYLRPTFTFGRDDRLQLTLQPRVWSYFGDLDGNPDIADYRGYADLRATLGWKRGLQLSALGRIGQSGEHQSLELDLTYPTMRLFGSFSFYLEVQYFTGYGESLLGYNKTTDQLRIGLALFR